MVFPLRTEVLFTIPERAYTVGTPMRVVDDPDYRGVESTIYHIYDNGRICLCFAPWLAFAPEALQVIGRDNTPY